MNPNCVIALMLLVFLLVFVFVVDKIKINRFIDRFTNKKIDNFQGTWDHEGRLQNGEHLDVSAHNTLVFEIPDDKKTVAERILDGSTRKTCHTPDLDTMLGPCQCSKDFINNLFYINNNYNVQSDIANVDMDDIQINFKTPVFYYNIYKVKDTPTKSTSNSSFLSELPEGTELWTYDISGPSIHRETVKGWPNIGTSKYDMQYVEANLLEQTSTKISKSSVPKKVLTDAGYYLLRGSGTIKACNLQTQSKANSLYHFLEYNILFKVTNPSVPNTITTLTPPKTDVPPTTSVPPKTATPPTTPPPPKKSAPTTSAPPKMSPPSKTATPPKTVECGTQYIFPNEKKYIIKDDTYTYTLQYKIDDRDGGGYYMKQWASENWSIHGNDDQGPFCYDSHTPEYIKFIKENIPFSGTSPRNIEIYIYNSTADNMVKEYPQDTYNFVIYDPSLYNSILNLTNTVPNVSIDPNINVSNTPPTLPSVPSPLPPTVTAPKPTTYSHPITNIPTTTSNNDIIMSYPSNTFIIENFDNTSLYSIGANNSGITASNIHTKILTCAFFFKTLKNTIDRTKIQMLAFADSWRVILEGNIVQLIIGGTTLESSVKINNDSLHHCTVTIGNDEVNLYIDGNQNVLKHNVPDGFITTNITFGRGSMGLTHNFNGYIGVNKSDIIRYRILDRETICSIYPCKNSIPRYIPRGDTLQQCIQYAYSDKMCDQFTEEEDISKCQKSCQIECHNCNDTDNCLWLKEEDIKDIDNPYATEPSPPNIRCIGLASKIKVDWVEPNDGGSKIESYMLIVYETGAKNRGIRFLQMTNGNNKNCEYIVTNLKNQIEYDIYVVAINKVGMSDLSNLGNATPIGSISPVDISPMLLASDDEIHKRAYEELAKEGSKLRCESVLGSVTDGHILNDINRQSFANSVKQSYSNQLDDIKEKLMNKLNPDW